MTKENNIALLPLDNRPVSYLLPKQIADFSGIDLILPERKYLGDFKKGSDLDYLEKWLKDLSIKHSSMLFVISLDNWVYGGLIQSRKHDFTPDVLKKRVDLLENILSKHSVYGFSSIMRLASTSSVEEEKQYWGEYGKKIYNWSELMYKVGRGIKEEGISHKDLIENWYQSSKTLPIEVLTDYRGHRDKNLTVNTMWLESLHKKCFKYLIFSCDDSAKYGINVVEAEYLKQEIGKHNFSTYAKVISGTDEIPLVLVTKALIDRFFLKPSISMYFNSTDGMNKTARYENNSIYDSVIEQIKTLNIEMKDHNEADINLYIHCTDSEQGDHIFKEKAKTTKDNISKLIKLIKQASKPFIILDLAYANGADPDLIEELLKSKVNWDRCYGYAGWNTCSNSMGSALAIAVNRWIAEQNKSFDKEAFKKCLLVRFLDDYAYQAKIRHFKVTEQELNNKMKNYIQTFSQVLCLNDINVNCSLPWNRSFEVEIEIRN